MIRRAIINKIKSLDLKVLRWQDYNDVWNDLSQEYGTTKEEFLSEINLMVEEGILIPLNPNSHHTDYKII